MVDSRSASHLFECLSFTLYYCLQFSYPKDPFSVIVVMVVEAVVVLWRIFELFDKETWKDKNSVKKIKKRTFP